MAAALAPRGAAPGPPLYSPAYSADAPNTDSRPTLLVTTVDIGEGRQGRVEVRAGDNPIDVARAFCARHGLPEAIVLPLAQHLEDNLAESIAGAGGDYSEEEPEEVGGSGAAVRLGGGWAGRGWGAWQVAMPGGWREVHCRAAVSLLYRIT